MKIVKCPNCKLGVSFTADICPHCGITLPNYGLNWMGFITLAVAILLIFIMLFKAPDEDRFKDQQAALSACKAYINARIKDLNAGDFDTANAKILQFKEDSIAIYLQARTPNTVKASVPTTFACFVENKNGTWEVDKMEETK